MQRLPRRARALGPAALAALALAACSETAAGGRGPTPDADPPPSVILISIDTLRRDHVGLYGYGRDTTPYLDRLAAECLTFDRAYTTAAWTLVAHMSMMTGLDPARHGVLDSNRALSDELPTLAERLRDAGYRTLGFYYGAWLGARYGFERGFSVYRDHEDAEQARRHLERELARQAPDRPLFLFVHLFDVHSAAFEPGFRGFYDPPAPHDAAFHPAARAVLADVDCESAWFGAASLDPERHAAMVALYDGGIRYVDAWLERQIEAWRASGLLDRSLLIVTSDHGEALGDHGTYNGHGGMYEEGLRIPLLVRFPDGFRAGEREEGPVSVVDFVPTALEAARLPIEPWRSGRSLRLPPPADRVLFAAREDVTAAIGLGWKVVFGAAGSGYAYQLKHDPAEARRLRKEDAITRKLVAGARRALADDRASRPLPPGTPRVLGELGEAERKSLADLGYAAEAGGR